MQGSFARPPVAVAGVAVALVVLVAACHGDSGKHARATTTTGSGTAATAPSIASSTTTSPRSAAQTSACGRGPDRTASVNLQITAARNGTTVTFPRDACLRVDGTVNLVGRHGLTIDGNGATFVRTVARAGKFSPQWLVQLSSRITITGVHIVGPKPGDAGFEHDYEGQPGVAIDNSTDIAFGNSTITDVWGDFFRISNTTDGVRITGNQLTEAGRQGLAVVGGTHITFAGNVVTRARRFAVDLEPYPSTPVRHVSITNNRFFDPAIGFVCATGYDSRCDRGPALSDVTVEGNIQEG